MTKQEAINFITSLPEHARVHVLVQEASSLKASEVMSMLNISRVTLCHYVKKGLITIDSNYTGKQYRYNKDSVMALIQGTKYLR
jgi:hypothetical protein